MSVKYSAYVGALPVKSTAPASGDIMWVWEGGVTPKQMDMSLISGGGGGLTAVTAVPSSGGSAGAAVALKNAFPRRGLWRYVSSQNTPVPINMAIGVIGRGGGSVVCTWENKPTAGNLLVAFLFGMGGRASSFTSGWANVASTGGPNTYPTSCYKFADAGDAASLTVTPLNGTTGFGAAVVVLEFANAQAATAPTGNTTSNIGATAGHFYLMASAYYNNGDGAFRFPMLLQPGSQLMAFPTFFDATSGNYFGMGVQGFPLINSVVPGASSGLLSSVGLINTPGLNNTGTIVLDISPGGSTTDYWEPTGL